VELRPQLCAAILALTVVRDTVMKVLEKPDAVEPSSLDRSTLSDYLAAGVFDFVRIVPPTFCVHLCCSSELRGKVLGAPGLGLCSFRARIFVSLYLLDHLWRAHILPRESPGFDVSTCAKTHRSTPLAAAGDRL
jgi:hypothetical protein